MIDAAFRNTLVLVLMTILVIVAVIALFILIHIVVLFAAIMFSCSGRWTVSLATTTRGICRT